MQGPTGVHSADSPGQDSETSGLRELASEYSQEAWRAQEHAEGLGRRHRRVHFGVAILAALAGVVAGTAGIAEGAPGVAGVAGFSATALVGLNTVLNAEKLARFHFT